MRYCPDCGNGHDCVAVTGAERADVEIARINADRDVQIARYQARAAEHIAETEAEHDASHAEGVAEGMETALDAVTGNDEPPEGDPIVVDADTAETEPEPEPEPGPDLEPPVVEVPEPVSRSRGGYWGAYR